MSLQKILGGGCVRFNTPPSILGTGCVVGKKEGEGPLRDTFDLIGKNTRFGEKSWEKAESRMQQLALQYALKKADVELQALDCIVAGDLLNQCVASAFALRDAGTPFLGLYGACSTMAEGLALSAVLLDGGFAERTAAMTSSHYCTAERQYRMPLEYGGQRTPTAQWTATAAGCVIAGRTGPGPYITHAAVGHIVDAGIKDAANMGAAMAPAAYETLAALFRATDTAPGDYDLILTGDLARLGAEALRMLFLRDGIELGSQYRDCGEMLYDAKKQDAHMGASGCGCSAAVLCGTVIHGMRQGVWKRVIFAGTGALLSPLTALQGESVPGICHAVILSNQP